MAMNITRTVNAAILAVTSFAAGGLTCAYLGGLDKPIPAPPRFEQSYVAPKGSPDLYSPAVERRRLDCSRPALDEALLRLRKCYRHPEQWKEKNRE